MKVAVIGAGSTYTPELLEGLGGRDQLDVDTIALHDVDQGRLGIVAAAAERIARAHGYSGRVLTTTELDRAVDGASFVLVQIRVGGQSARRLDETIPLRCGCIGQETTGAGGFAKALRTVPVALDIAAAVRRSASADAWIVDFTNPVGIVTRALLDAGHRALGLCNVAIGFQRQFAQLLSVQPNEIQLQHAGLNHLTWINAVHVDGVDVLPELLREHGDDIAEQVELPRRLIDLLHAVPSYYLRYYYEHDVLVERMRNERTRADQVEEIEKDLLNLYADPNIRDKPERLMQRGGAYYSEAALQLMTSLHDGDGRVHVVNVRNQHTLPELPDDAVVEVPARIATDGAHPVALGERPSHQRGLIAHVASYESLTAGAAVTGDRDLAFEALLTHPLVGQSNTAERLLHDLLEANQQYLPAFR